MIDKKEKGYNAKDISVLEGLDPVKKLPGMYTRTESPNHIMQEIADNAFDEALGGHANKLLVELHEDGSVSIEDNGRGIPVDIHPEKNVPAVQIIFTVLHSGGKFDKGEGGAYDFSGGLHGVGVSVTNALSERLEVTVWRNRKEYFIAFEHGKVVEPLKEKKLGEEDKNKKGTKIQAWPSAQYFTNPHLVINEFESYLKNKAVLINNVEVTWVRPSKTPITWHFPGGIKQYLEEQAETPESWVAPLFQARLEHKEENNGFKKGEGFDLALGFMSDNRIQKSYVNLISTTSGGRHESGLRAGLFEAIKPIAERNKAIPKDIKLEAEDVWARVSFVLSAKLMKPAFQNQTKDKLIAGQGDVGYKLVYGLIKDAFELWMNDHPSAAKSIIDLVVEEAVRRQKSANKVERKRGSGASVLPGKLADCESKNIAETELFLVEGDSAGGSSKEGRDRRFQAILPLRGKVVNTWEEKTEHLINKFETVNDIAVAIGVEPHGNLKAKDVDMTRLRYGKIIIMADADVDGKHIQVLLNTLFYKHFPALIEKSHIWVAQPPLFTVSAPPKKGKKSETRENRKYYVLDEKELSVIEKELGKEGLMPEQYKVSRFKGLGEMNPEQLWETTLNPEVRRMIRLSLPQDEGVEKDFDLMMSKKNAKQRRDWMEADGSKIVVDL